MILCVSVLGKFELLSSIRFIFKFVTRFDVLLNNCNVKKLYGLFVGGKLFWMVL